MTTQDDVNAGTDAAVARLAAADNCVKSYAIGAMGLGLVPVPVVDTLGVIAVQRKMIHALTRIYGVRFLDDIAKTYILSLVGGLLPLTLGTGLASMVKLVPGVGLLGGTAGVSVLAGASTVALGRVFTAHFESGGTLLDFKPDRMRAAFRREFERGRREARDLSRQARSRGRSSHRPKGRGPSA